ncbi:wall-associated protein [Listeria rocourtiae FSL F6-920]|nr:wall-associated protein [Listeria rocourtiae FSL F6-920]
MDNKKAGKTSYEYDAINQLTKETLPDGTVKAYTYDGFGNRTKVTDSSKTKAIEASYNDGNQLTAWNGDKLTFDTNGNRLSDGTYTYTWDTADQLTAIMKKGETTPFATYQYDDDNRRIEKTVNGQTTKYYYDGDSIDVLYETDGAGTVQRQYVYSDSNVRMAMKVGAKTIFYHYNAHGDVVALTNEAGDLVAEYSYDAWGNVLQAIETTNEAKQNPFGYAGYTYDKEISMYYLMARYYEPEQGIFISVDPDPGDEDDPLTMNSYNYANNNPVMHIDPDGHWVWLAINAGFAAYDGYKSYKKTKSLRKAGIAAAKGALGGGKFKLARKAAKGVRYIGKINKPLKVKPKGYSWHGINRAISRDGRGTSTSAILSTIKRPKRTIVNRDKYGRGIKMIGKRSTVVVNMKRKIITVYPRGKGNSRVKKNKKNKGHDYCEE